MGGRIAAKDVLVKPAISVVPAAGPPPRLMFRTHSLVLRDAIRRLSTLSQRRWGRRLPTAVERIRDGEDVIGAGLYAVMHEHVQRSEDRAQAEEFRHVVLALLEEQFAAMVDAKFGAAPVPAFAVASLAEQRIDGAVDALQVEVAHTPTPGLFATLRVKAREQIAALEQLCTASLREERTRGWS